MGVNCILKRRPTGLVWWLAAFWRWDSIHCMNRVSSRNGCTVITALQTLSSVWYRWRHICLTWTAPMACYSAVDKLLCSFQVTTFRSAMEWIWNHPATSLPFKSTNRLVHWSRRATNS